MSLSKGNLAIFYHQSVNSNVLMKKAKCDMICVNLLNESVLAITSEYEHLLILPTVRAVCSSGSQTQAEQQLQDDSGGRDDCLERSPRCAETQRHRCF